jgi:hypothetical protein
MRCGVSLGRKLNNDGSAMPLIIKLRGLSVCNVDTSGRSRLTVKSIVGTIRYSPFLYRWYRCVQLSPRSQTHTVGKTQTQKMERKHLTFRTRLKRFVRKTICFSKSMRLHDIVIGLFVNRYEFGILVTAHMCPLKLLPLNYHYLLPRWWSLGVQWAGVSSRVADLTRRADGASSDLCQSA